MIPLAEVLIATALLLAPMHLRAQPLVSTASGTRVRIDLPSTERSRFRRERPQSIVGTLGALHGDTLLVIVRTEADPLRVPLTSTRAAYASGGRTPRWQAALRGAVFPALTSAALNAISASINRGTDTRTPLQRATAGAAWGAASGAALGALFPKERWHRLTYTATSREATVATTPETKPHGDAR